MCKCECVCVCVFSLQSATMTKTNPGTPRPLRARGAVGRAGGIMKPFDTVQSTQKEKEHTRKGEDGRRGFSVPAEETFSVQLFSQRQHLAPLAQTQVGPEIPSAHRFFGEK